MTEYIADNSDPRVCFMAHFAYGALAGGQWRAHRRGGAADVVDGEVAGGSGAPGQSPPCERPVRLI